MPPLNTPLALLQNWKGSFILLDNNFKYFHIMYVISQLHVINIVVILRFSFQMLMHHCLFYPDEGLVVLSRKRFICVVFNKNVESSKVAAYCFHMVLKIHLFA